jgi:hypothetical protein
MAQTQISDVVVPAEFTAYQVENSMLSTALFQSGVVLPNGEMQAQLLAGAEQFTVPFWSDIPDIEADISTDNAAVLSTPQKITAAAQVVRKSFLHASWSEMSLASELSGSDALVRVQSRVGAYWDRQFEKRLIASLLGVLYSNVANNGGDMVNDIHATSGTVTLPGTTVTVPANAFNGLAVINTALTIGDRLSDMKAIAMHSYIYGEALKNNLQIPTYKGMACIVDDNLTAATAGVRREGESEAGTQASSEGHSAKGQEGGLRQESIWGSAAADLHFLVRPSSRPEGRSVRSERHDSPTRWA